MGTIREAFTLAEATLTLFMLSVIAAILIPAAVNIAPDQYRTGLKTAYNMTLSTVDSLINNETLYPSEELLRNDTIRIPKGFLYEDIKTEDVDKAALKEQYIKEGSTAAEAEEKANNAYETSLDSKLKTNTLEWEYEALTKNCKCNNSKTKKLVRAFCCSMNVSSASCPDSGTTCTYTTNNGMVWTLTQTDLTVDGDYGLKPIMYVEVDLNGTGKPNSKTATSPDQYKFSVFYNGRVELFTTTGNDDYNTSSAKAKTYLETPTKNKKKQ